MSDITNAIRVHLNAISVLLPLLEQSFIPAASSDADNPKCPACGSGVSDMTCMGDVRKQYGCTGQYCSWQGEI